MKKRPRILTAMALGLIALISVPDSRAELARFIQVVKVDDADTRFHLGELEAFENGVVPDDLGGAEHTQEAQFESKATSTNDVGGVDGEFLTTYNDGAEFPEIGTTDNLEHGGANKDPNNQLELAGQVWSTANGLGEANAQYTLDLGEQLDITTLRLFPRNDACCSQRWENLQINLYQDDNGVPGKLSATVTHTENQGNIALEFILPPGINTLEEGLLGYWSFNDLKPGDTETLDANNSADTKSNGTVLGNPELSEGPAGEGDVAIVFDGIDDAVTTEGQILNDTASFTMSGWVKFDEQPGTRIGLFGQNDSVEFGMINPTTMQHWSAAGGAFDIPFGPVIEEWTNIVLVNSPTERILYVNGEEEARGGGSDPSNSAFPFNIGGAGVYDATGNFFTGEMDDIAVWNRQLTPEEALQVFETRAIIAPDFVDTDGDGMGDRFEADNGLDPFDASDRDTDLDGDTLSNFAEFENRTNPNNKDTDGDGLDDNVETDTGTYVSASDTGTRPTNADSDRDGLLDGVETNTGTFVSAEDTGTNPHIKDTDEDGATDGLEVSSGFDPTDPTSVASIQLKGGNFTVRHVTSSVITDRAGMESVLSGDEAPDAEITVQAPFINYVDNAAAAFTDSIQPYPLWGLEGSGEGAAFPGLPDDLGGGPAHDNFAIEATGKIFIQQPGGMVTFVVNSDDGFVLTIDGVEVGEAGNRGRGNSFMTVDLAAGQHDITFTHWEAGGGAGGNVMIARGFGEVTTFNEGDFELLNAFDIALAPLEGNDSDEDGMADLWEDFYFGDLASDGTGDEDGDGLNDRAEYENLGNPTVKDTDGDGVEDGPEVNTHGSSPALVDSDGDTLTDGDEVNVHGTSPASADSDGDGSSDAIELAFNTDPNNADERPDAVAAVQSGDWNDASTWEDGLAPSAGKNYVVLSGIVNDITATQGAFGGDSLTLLGSTLNLTAAGSQANLVINGGTVAAETDVALGGKINVAGGATIDAGDNEFTINSQLSGMGSIAFVGGSLDAPTGSIGMAGPASSHIGDVSVTGTALFVFSENGIGGAGEGSISLQAAELHVNAPLRFCGDLQILGADFVLGLNSTLEVTDLKGISEADGSVVFSLQEGAPNAELTTADLEGAGFNSDTLAGDGTLKLNDSPVCSLPGCDDPNADTDSDGLSDCDETLEYGTSATNPDSDEDGVEDGVEIADGTNPLSPDSDGDGATDGEEKAAGTNPLVFDAPAPVVHYDFNEGSGTDIANMGSLGGGGQLLNPHAGAWVASGSPDGSGYLNFTQDGGTGDESQHVATGLDASAIPVSGDVDYTMMAWARPDTIAPGGDSEDGMIFGQSEAGNVLHNGLRGGNYHFGHWGADTNGGSVAVNEWQHITWKYEAGVQSILVNGELIIAEAKAALAVESEVVIGMTRGDQDRDFSGDLDDIRIYDVALPNDVIKTIATGGGGPVEGGFVFDPSFSIPDGTSYNVEYSPDLESAFEVIATDQTGVFTDTDAGRASAKQGFYRGVTAE